MATLRRKARATALQTLFEVDSAGHDPELSLSHLLEERNLPEDAVSFARELIEGVLGNKQRLDETIQAYAPAYPVEQLFAIDRNILRMALFELIIQQEVPPRAVINEAVELAKAFGGENSPKFINGVLGSVSRASPSLKV